MIVVSPLTGGVCDRLASNSSADAKRPAIGWWRCCAGRVPGAVSRRLPVVVLFPDGPDDPEAAGIRADTVACSARQSRRMIIWLTVVARHLRRRHYCARRDLPNSPWLRLPAHCEDWHDYTDQRRQCAEQSALA